MSRCLPWPVYVRFPSLDLYLDEAAKQMLLTFMGVWDPRDDPCTVYTFEGELSNLPSVPSDVKAITLGDEGGTIMLDNWPHKGSASGDYITEFVPTGYGVGLEKEGRLVSFSTQYRHGMQGSTGTTPDMRRRGYGKTTVAEQTRRTLEYGLIPCVDIINENKASIGMYKGLGYKPNETSCYVGFIE